MATYAVLAKNYPNLLEEAVERAERDGVGRAAFRASKPWKAPFELLQNQVTVPIYFRCGPELGRTVHYAGTLLAVFNDSPAQAAKAELDQHSVGRWEGAEIGSVYVVDRCRRVQPTDVTALTKHDGTPVAGGGSYQFTIVNAAELLPAGTWYPDDVGSREAAEGAVTQVLVNRYERDAGLRDACIEKYGVHCTVCRMSFADVYGAIGRDFIHVHHLTPLSALGGEARVTVDDLVPICPNCHAMVHRKKCSPEELRQAMASRRAGPAIPDPAR